MARASRNVRKQRRLKRERTIAWRAVKLITLQRDYALAKGKLLEQELSKLNNPTPVGVETTITSTIEATAKPSLTITKIQEDNEPVSTQADRPDQDSAGLEVPQS